MLRFFHFRGAELAYLPRTTVKMRAGGQSNASLGNRIKANAEDAKAWRLNGQSPPALLRLRKPLRKLSQFAKR
jgi:glycosyltransferase